MMGLTTVATAVVLLGCHDLMAPLRSLLTPDSANKYLNPAGTVVVYPGSMRGWAFYDDQASAACTTVAVCAMVSGPGSPSSGSGSAELATTTASEGKALILADYKGVRFDAITALSYSTYRQSVDAGNNLAIALQFNADYDLSDAATGYQGRLVYEPYQGNSGTVTQGAWQNWDAKAGKWWGTRASVMRNGVATTNPCVQATPCTWTALLSAFPNVGVHATYGAVVLKAGSGWASFRGNVDAFSIGIAGTTTTFDFEAVGPVPASPPDSITQAMWDEITRPTNLISRGRGRIVRDVVSIQFFPSATLADRQYAIGLVNGVVIGGSGVGYPEHDYLVRMPYVLSAGDGSLDPLLRAIDMLKGLPTVEFATLEILNMIAPNYLKPRDGPGFRHWPLSRDSATGANWGQIAVNAPFAWGCVTGTAPGQMPISIAIVDEGFHNVFDLQGNLGPVRQFTSDTAQHGTAVAGIVGAVGGNDSGITGMLWHAKLNLYDRQKPVPMSRGYAITEQNASQAVTDGAQIVNLSWGLDGSLLSDTLNKADSNVVETFARAFKSILAASRDPATGKLRTLFVISAGNADRPTQQNISTYWNGWGAIKQKFPQYANNMIIVAATYRTGPSSQALDPGSFAGPLVDIAAPGMDIATLGKDSTITVAGTSIAASFVTGIAGMLMSFDPSLPPDSVKKLILVGARSNSRDLLNPRDVSDATDPSHPKPVPDAYESLKLVANGQGAPLCGNRVYSLASGAVYATRGPNPDDSLFTSIDRTPYTDLLNALHGGKRIQIGDYLEFAWNSSTRSWGSTAFNPNYHENAGGAFLSWYDGTEHDGNTYAIANTVSGSGGLAWGVDLYPAKVGGYRRTLAASPTFLTTSLVSDVCTRILIAEGAACQPSDVTGSGWVESASNAQLAFAPQGNAVYVAVNRRWHEQIIYGPSQPCTWYPYYDPGKCATYLPARDSSVSVSLYLVDTTGTTPWKPVSIDILSGSNVKSGVNVSWLAIDETGTELVWEVAKDYSDGAGSSCTQHTIEYLRLPNGSPPTLPGAIKSVPRPNSTNCGAFGPATFSPLKSPWQQPLLKSLVPSRGVERRNRPHA